MSSHELVFAYPGDLNTRTGGYRYDKRIIEELRKQHPANWHLGLMSLAGDYPFPDATQQAMASAQFATIADNTTVLVDGLAYSAMPHVIAAHAHRLTFIALVHHPLALETGLSESQSQTLRQSETDALTHADYVITTSELTAQSLIEYNVATDKVTAVLPGTDLAPIAHGSDTQTLNLLCVATLTQRKGHRVLFDALATLDHLPWHLHCAGSTDRDDHTHGELVKQCHALALDKRVSFTGELDDAQLDHYYDQADLFVLASYHEGYGMVLSEAIARGLPIVCTNAGAIPQTVPEGAGLLVSAGNAQALATAIGSFMEDPQLNSTMRSAAQKARTQLRTWQQAAAEFADVLARV